MKSIGELTISESVQFFAEIQDVDTLSEIGLLLHEMPSDANVELSNSDSERLNKIKSFIGKEHVYAYVSSKKDDDGFYEIQNALSIRSDKKLKGERVNIRIGNIYIDRYPGTFGKDHEVLFEFKAKHAPLNKSGEESEERLTFSQVYTLNNGEGSGIQGYMAFQGLRIPKNGVDFSLRTIYVKNRRAKRIFSVFSSDVIQEGLKLIPGVNPVISVVSKYSDGISDILSSEGGRVVQDIGFGFDFSNRHEVAGIKLGTYIAIQAKRRDELNIRDIVYDSQNSVLINKETRQRIPFNHISFVISKFEQ